MVEVNWTPQSLQDIENIAKFISKDSLRFAKIQTQRFFESVLILERFPKSGRIVPEIKLENISELILGNYRIVYKIINRNKIDILAVHQSARELRINYKTK